MKTAMLLTLALTAVSAAAMQSGTTPQGAAYVSGGISHQDLRALHERRNEFNLWVVTAAAKSGAYLADVLVTIRDSKKQVVFNRRLEGPWLFINLPLGTYQVEAALDGKAQTRTTTIHRGDLHQAFFYFDTGDTVGEENSKPFENNPYDGKKKR